MFRTKVEFAIAPAVLLVDPCLENPLGLNNCQGTGISFPVAP
jgi:hypothetical protein